MIAQLNDIAQIWWQWMGSMFWQVSLLIVLITALDMAIRKWAWPQVRYALWGLVFIKLIIPPTWQMPTSIVSWIKPQVEDQINIQIDTSNRTANSSETLLHQSKEKEPVAVDQATWKTFVLLGWVAGMSIFSLMLIKKMSRLRKWHQIQDIGSIPEWLHELMVKTARRLKLKKIPSIIISKDAKSPAVYGVFRPVLLLPKGYMELLPHNEAEHVLIHELFHLKRGDVWVHCFCIVLQIIYWFNPLLIWSRRQMRHVCEICCDLSVANILREETFKYRETLLRSARELFTETLEPGLGLLGIFEEPFRLVPRLKWLEKKSWENRKRRIAVTICASLVMITCVMPMAGLSHSGEKNNTHLVQSDLSPVESNGQQIPDESGVSKKVIITKSESKSLDEGSNISAVVDQGLRRQQLQQIDLEIPELKAMIDATNTRMKQYQAKVEDTPKREQELLSLNRDYESLKAIYNSLLNRKLEAEIAIEMEKKQVEGTSEEIDKKLGTLAFLDDELKDTEKRLIEKEEEIRDYKQKYMGGLPEQLQTNLAILEQLQSKIERLNADLRNAENIRAAFLKDIAASTTQKEDGDTLTYLKKALSLLESRYAQEHPDIIRLKEIIANIEAEE